MREFDCDVAVVGTGPGGGAAALRLAETGLRTVILEKEKLPRPKACGGAMPGAMLDQLPKSCASLVEAEVKNQVFRYDHSERTRSLTMADPMILVDRASFDHALIKRAVETPGAKLCLREGWEVVAAGEDAVGVTLRERGGDSLRCRYVIAADGATSRVARNSGLYNRAGGAAVDAHVAVSPEVFAAEHHRVTFDVHCVEAGYGWIFPKSDHLSCGVGMWRRPRRLLSELDDFLAQTFPEGSVGDVRTLSHPVPVFQGHRPLATNRICLVGDAAHMVDPVLGEGIKYAFEAGRMAADVVACLCKSCGADLSRYSLGAEVADGANGVFHRHGTCHAYGDIARYTVARELNLIRLREDRFFSDPAAVYSSILS